MTAEVVELPPGYIAGTWAIDPVHSHVGFAVRHVMVARVRGRFASFHGTIVTGADPADSSVTATIDPASVDTGNDTRDQHLRSADFLDVERHPAMSYRSTGLRLDGGEPVVDGELTIKGVTRAVPLRLEIHGFGPDPFPPDPGSGARVGFTATTEINRSDFGVSYNGPIPGGGVMIAERVQITLDIEAVLQDRHT